MPAEEAQREPGRLRYPWFFWTLVALSLVALVLAAWVLWLNHDAATAQAAPVPKKLEPAPAADFQLTAIGRQPVRLSELHGQVVLLNFWATWCPPCQAEMPDLQALYRDNAAKHKFTVVGVDVEEDQAKTAAFARLYGLTFPLLADSDGKVSTYRYYVRGLPTSYIIDRDGNVRYQWSGQQSREAMLRMLGSVW